MPHLSFRDSTTLILIGAITFSAAAAPSIGVAVARGSFQVDSSEVFGNTTLFDGATVETQQASSRLRLNNGTSLNLGEDSRAKVFEKRMTLERGIGEVTTSSVYQLEARTLRISTDGAKAIARVKLEGEKQVLVAAVNGRVRVLNEGGLLVANLKPGASLLFTPQAAQSAAFQMSGCLVGTRDGKFLLVDSNQTVELRGSGLAAEINNRVEVTGTAFRSAVPTPPAAQVIQVDGIKRAEAGGCQEAIAKLESEGVKVLKAGQASAGKAPAAAKSGGSHAGIYAGVAVAVAGGVGAAVALGGKKSTSP